MPRISRSKLAPEKLQEITDHFSYLVSSLTHTKDIEGFLMDFLTREEKIMLAKRLVLFMMIKKGYEPQFIQQMLHLSYETVRTYTNQCYEKNAIFHGILDKMLDRQKTKDFWRKIDTFLKPVELLLNSKRNMKARAKFISGDWEG